MLTHKLERKGIAYGQLACQGSIDSRAARHNNTLFATIITTFITTITITTLRGLKRQAGKLHWCVRCVHYAVILFVPQHRLLTSLLGCKTPLTSQTRVTFQSLHHRLLNRPQPPYITFLAAALHNLHPRQHLNRQLALHPRPQPLKNTHLSNQVDIPDLPASQLSPPVGPTLACCRHPPRNPKEQYPV